MKRETLNRRRKWCPCLLKGSLKGALIREQSGRRTISRELYVESFNYFRRHYEKYPMSESMISAYHAITTPVEGMKLVRIFINFAAHGGSVALFENSRRNIFPLIPLCLFGIQQVLSSSCLYWHEGRFSMVSNTRGVERNVRWRASKGERRKLVY